jgi:hypothetical protein
MSRKSVMAGIAAHVDQHEPHNRLMRDGKVELLVKAAEEGNTAEVIRLIERESKYLFVGQKDKKLSTVLFVLVGVDLNSQNNKRFATALMVSAANSHYKLVHKLLLRENLDLWVKDSAGWNALHWACWGAGAGGGWQLDSTFKTLEELIQVYHKLDTFSPCAQTFSGHTAVMLFVKHMNEKNQVGGSSAASESKVAEGDETSMTPEARRRQTKKEQKQIFQMLLTTWYHKTEQLLEVKNQYGEKLENFVRHVSTIVFLRYASQD